MSPLLETLEQNLNSDDHILDWLEDTVSFLPSFLNDSYNVEEANEYQWWEQNRDLIDSTSTPTLNVSSDHSTCITSLDLPTSSIPQSSDSSSSRKRKSPTTPNSKSPQEVVSKSCHIGENNESDAVVEEEVVKVKRTVSTKKAAAKGNGNNSNNGNSKEGRWAEQLLNPCAIAISNGNLSRVQHLLYVLHELASPSGDANNRLATHGLRALTHHLSSSTTPSFSTVSPITFASTEPRLFLRSLLKFYEISPWFTFPNAVANASILQILAQETDCLRTVHIVDMGVSHGLQWPTLLEALSHRSGGPPPLVRLTIVVAASMQNNGLSAPFSMGPAGDDFPSRLLRFAKSINLNLQINLLNNHPLEALNPQTMNTSPDETLIVCAQFRLHCISHTIPDDRTDFLKTLRSFEPKAVILCENDLSCSCKHCGDFTTGFTRRVEYLWRFLDTTSSAFKGRECEERRVMEGEAATALINGLEMNEGKEKWCEKMRRVGFIGEVFGEDVIDGARALLRKYDSNWEMKIDDKDKCVCLGWKGQPVSFCSLWKPFTV
ncbi:Nodulation-signaling pathway 1 protein [Thalictrum thalictroides]|uniref:Nodulation-signaling pathway 1 protein n=1 Tax=Thalictrum thalictroides TaxID=46969 RepID=A0A7J6WX39_THATH|nr:Nodulation-signaling pathway 1 protein [Thalictrum thalictroides]